VKNFGEICVLSLIYSYVVVCRFCAVRCLIIICFPLLFYNYSTCVFNILPMFVFLFCTFVFYFVYSEFLYCWCTVSPFVQSSLLFLYKFTDLCHRVETQLQ